MEFGGSWPRKIAAAEPDMGDNFKTLLQHHRLQCTAQSDYDIGGLAASKGAVRKSSETKTALISSMLLQRAAVVAQSASGEL